jgi:hypothetical protein
VNAFDELQGGGEHVAVVVSAKLFASDAERRARNASRQKVDAGKTLVPKVADVLLFDIPLGPVLSKCGAELGLVLDSGGVMEPGHLEAEGLTTATSTQF